MVHRRREDWRAICAASFESGLSVRAFAEHVGVPAGTLAGWRSRFRDEQQGALFVELAREENETELVGTVVVRVGEVVVTMSSLPPARWLAELAGSC